MRPLITFWLFTLTLFSETALAEQKLQLVLRLGGKVFVQSQAIWAHVTLANRGGSGSTVPQSVLTEDPGAGIRFLLLSPTASPKVQSGGLTTCDFSEKDLAVRAGDSINQSFNVLQWFSNSPREKAGGTPYLATRHFLLPGSYKLQALQPIGKDTLKSAQISFSVAEPRGTDKTILDQLKRADDLYVNQIQKSPSSPIQAYEAIVNNYPSSIYTPYACDRLVFIFYYISQDHARAFETIRTLAERFPNDPQSVRLIVGFASLLMRESHVLEQLLRDHPNTEIAKQCRYELDKSQK